MENERGRAIAVARFDEKRAPANAAIREPKGGQIGTITMMVNGGEHNVLLIVVGNAGIAALEGGLA